MFRGPLSLDKFESDVDYVVLIFRLNHEKVNYFFHNPSCSQRAKQHDLNRITNAKYRWGASVAQLDRARH